MTQIDTKSLMEQKTKQFQELQARLGELDRQRTSMIEELMRLQGEYRLLQSLDGKGEGPPPAP